MQKILNKLTDKKYRRYLAAVLCVLVLALLFIPDNKETKTETEEQKPKLTEAYSYVAETEERLEKLISEIEGAGDTEIMLAFEGTEEYIYSTDISSNSANSDGKRSEQLDTKLVTVGGSSDKRALQRSRYAGYKGKGAESGVGSA